MTDWGVHLIDIVVWGMQADYPRRVLSAGGNYAYPDSAMQTPDTQQAIYEFDGFSMIWEHAVGIGLGPFQRGHGIAFSGNNGTQWEIYPERNSASAGGPRTYKMDALPAQVSVPDARGLNQHTENFIDCVKARSKPRCDVATASLAAVNAHLGNVALRTGDTLDWSAKKGRFVGHDKANSYLTPKYRKPWVLPKV